MSLMKYNPGFLPDRALIDSFCVRLVELESLLETLRETKGDSNVHRLVIGPRGSGKTTLVLRVAAGSSPRTLPFRDVFPSRAPRGTL